MVKIDSSGTFSAAAKHMYDLMDRGRPADAIAFADGCEGTRELTTQIRALARTDAGEALCDRKIVEQGAELWRELEGDGPRVKYHLANAEIGIWQIAVKEDRYVRALEGSRQHLQCARNLFAAVANDSRATEDLRVRSLTNLGNSMDSMGRDADAIDFYDRALAIDPSFGMALGNKGVALLGIVSYTPDHKPALLRAAVDLLDAALDDRERILEIGGTTALEHFERDRARITVKGTPAPRAFAEWDDPYLAWCSSERLFLHGSLDCVSPDSQLVDPLFFRRVLVGLSDAEQSQVNRLVDAFDVIKQDYLAARYLVWLTTSPASPIAEHASQLAKRAKFYDSLSYARWGLKTGMAIQAFTATINMLDKIASFLHIYFEIKRKAKVDFRNTWHEPAQKGKADLMHVEIAAELAGERFNRGLLALCDLSCDLESDTPLNRLVNRRHAATHRFLVAHDMLHEPDEVANQIFERVEWRDLVDGTIDQLRTARAAMIYLGRTVDRRENLKHEEMAGPGGFIPTMPLWPTHPDLSELD